MRSLIGTVIAVAMVVASIGITTACSARDDSSQSRESQSRQSSYDRQVANQPARTMGYSPTRETINFWIATWDKPNKLSFVYLIASNGQKVGYFVFKGLPVSYCASLTPNYEFRDVPGDGDSVPDFQVPAPGVDGVYYSGGQCNTYYGRDATTNSYLEYNVGTGISALVYERPLPLSDVEPLGFTEVTQSGGVRKSD